MPTLHVVIPYYNEGVTVRSCLERVLAATLPDGWSASVVIVDDDSEPAQRAVLDELVASLRAAGHRIEARRHEHNRGKGAALATGFDVVLGSDAADDDLVIIQDADLEYDPADYGRLLEPLERGEADAVIGTRFGEHRQHHGLYRRLHAGANSGLTRLSNLMTGLRLHDMECCYKLMPVELLRRMRPRLSETRYGIEPQIVAVLAALGASVAEVPVSYDPRSAEEGKKIGWIDGLRALWVIARERRRRSTATRPEELSR